MDKNPVISFCIPTYNRANRVFACVTHILKYPHDKIEVVVSDNASTDNTKELLSGIKDKRLTAYSNETNIYGANWPLAVSRAAGTWAVLMSDEDIVNLDAIDYYIENVLDPQMGLIIYSFPPVVTAINYTYKCKTLVESVYNVIKFGGHITGVVYNMGLFSLKSLDDYSVEKCFSVDYPDDNITKTEPQLQIAMENAAENLAMLTEVPICFYGHVENKEKELKDIQKSGSSIEAAMGGWLPSYRMHSINVLIEFISENVQDHSAALYNAALRKMLLLIGGFYGQVLTYKGQGSDTALWDYARNELGPYDRNRAVAELCDWFTKAVARVVEISKDDSFNKFILPFKQCFCGHFSSAPPEGLTYTQRIMLGDTLFSIILKFYMNFNQAAKMPDEYLAEDYSDNLGMKSREILRQMMRDKDYDAVISFDAPDNVRTRYYKGEAYFYNNDIDKAKECFEYIAKKTREPEVLDDMIINEIAIQYSLYYLGIIMKRKGAEEQAENYFSECYELSDELLIRGNLVCLSNLLQEKNG